MTLLIMVVAEGGGRQNHPVQGRIQDFHGGHKILCAESPRSLIRPESSFRGFDGFLVLSEPFIFEHSDTKWDNKTHSIYQISKSVTAVDVYTTQYNFIL